MTTQRSILLGVVTAVGVCAGSPWAAGLSATPGLDRGRALIEAHVFAALRLEDQERVVAAGAYLPPGCTAVEAGRPASDAEYAPVRAVVDREVFDRLNAAQRALLHRLVASAGRGGPVPHVCFTPGTDPAIVRAFEKAHFPAPGVRFQPVTQWVSTATDAGPLGQGDQCTLRYSFVPDGTPIDDNVTPSNLFARMNVLYPGGPVVWQALYDQIFARWAQLCGVRYVREPNDDGVSMGNGGAFGVIGTRGDLRLSGAPIDGNSGVLAYNYYPDEFNGVGGDMVVDTNDNFYTDTANNSLKLRNVLAHEHGHGMGIAHVCPTLTMRLMEPFVSTNFDGPQTDDILAAQRNYGDQDEPNDSIAGATVPPAPGGAPQMVTPLSIDGIGDLDNFSFVAVPAGTLLTVSLSPLGFRYAENPQNGGCTANGTWYDPLIQRPLTLSIRSAGGAVLASSTLGTGGSPSIVFGGATGADLIAEVSCGDAVDAIQNYSLTYSAVPAAPALGLFLTAALPSDVSTGAATPVRVGVSSSAALTGTPTLFYRYSTAVAFAAVAMAPVPGVASAWQASLPSAPCFGTPQFYFSATTGATTATLPANAPAGVFTALVTRSRVTVFSDSFETDLGWGYGQPGDTAATGQWVRADPNATTAQPETANTGANCAVTANGAVGEAAGVNDVDSGFTTLLSPAFNLSSTRDARIAYARWYDNTGGQTPAADTFRVDISNNNGGTWTALEVVGPSFPGNQGGWVSVSLPVPTGVALTAQMRLRFIADDAGAGSLIEAALDDVVVTASPTADVNGNGLITVQDVFDFLGFWFALDLRADFNKIGGVTVQDIFDMLAAWFAGC